MSTGWRYHKAHAGNDNSRIDVQGKEKYASLGFFFLITAQTAIICLYTQDLKSASLLDFYLYEKLHEENSYYLRLHWYNCREWIDDSPTTSALALKTQITQSLHG